MIRCILLYHAVMVRFPVVRDLCIARGVGSAAALGTQSIASHVQWNLVEKVEKDFRLEVERGSRPGIHIDDSVIVGKLSRSLGQNFLPAPPRSLLAGDAKFLYHPRRLIHL